MCRFKDAEGKNKTDFRKAVLTKCQSEFQEGVQARGRRAEESAKAKAQAAAGGDAALEPAAAAEPELEEGEVHEGAGLAGVVLFLLSGLIWFGRRLLVDDRGCGRDLRPCC